MGQSTLRPRNFGKHSEEVAISRIQTTGVRVLYQKKRPHTMTVNEYYTVEKISFKEVS